MLKGKSDNEKAPFDNYKSSLTTNKQKNPTTIALYCVNVKFIEIDGVPIVVQQK